MLHGRSWAMMSSETKKWSSGIRTKRVSSVGYVAEAEGDAGATEEAGDGTSLRAPSEMRVSIGAEGDRERRVARGRPEAVRRPSMMVSSAASAAESTSCSARQRTSRPPASLRGRSWLFHERIPGVTAGASEGRDRRPEELMAGKEDAALGTIGRVQTSEAKAGASDERVWRERGSGVRRWEPGVKLWAPGPRPT